MLVSGYSGVGYVCIIASRGSDCHNGQRGLARFARARKFSCTRRPSTRTFHDGSRHLPFCNNPTLSLFCFAHTRDSSAHTCCGSPAAPDDAGGGAGCRTAHSSLLHRLQLGRGRAEWSCQARHHFASAARRPGYRERPIASFQGNDRNIAVLARAFNDLPLESVSSLYCSSAADNDLLRVLVQNGIEVQRFDTPEAAMDAAGEGAGVLLLADGYPAKTTALDAALFRHGGPRSGCACTWSIHHSCPAWRSGRRGARNGSARSSPRMPLAPRWRNCASWRSTGVTSCRWQAEDPHIVIGRVAGFDTAVYRPGEGIVPDSLLSCRSGWPRRRVGRHHEVEPVRHRSLCAPTRRGRASGTLSFTWLQPGKSVRALAWTAAVRPSFRAEDALPAGCRTASPAQRGIDWYFNARMVIHPVDDGAVRAQPAGQ